MMKWTSKKKGTVSRRALCVMLAVLVVLGSFGLAFIPVARAGTGDYTVMGGTPTWVKWSLLNTTQLYFAVAFSAAAPAGNDRYGSCPSGTYTTSWGATVYGGNYAHAVGEANGTVFSGWMTNFSKSVTAGTRVTVHMNAVVVGNGDFWHSCSFPANNLVFTAPTLSDSWRTWASVNGAVPVSVAITGASSVSIGSTSSYTATIANGTAPFTGHWTLTGLQTSLGPTVAVVGTTSVMPWTFGTVKGMQNIRYDVTDSVGGTASGLMDVKVGEYAPALKGQLYFAGDELRFALYPQASNPVGEYVEPGTENVMNTDNYTIDRVLLGVEWAYYRLADVAPLANPYVVHVSYVDPTNGRVYPYTFSFDTTLMEGSGDWGQGDGSHGGGELPSWAQALVDIMKAGFQALFVPNDAQMQLLLPSGTLGASLLEGTTWGAGSSTWNMHVHWGTDTITLVSMNFATIAGYGFTTAIRYCIQAGISLGLVYLVVVLI